MWHFFIVPSLQKEDYFTFPLYGDQTYAIDLYGHSSQRFQSFKCHNLHGDN